MPRKEDWLPHREQDLVDFFELWLAILSDTLKQTAYGWDSTECTSVANKITAFLNARSLYEAENSLMHRIAKDEAKKEAVNAVREFANYAIRFNKKMTEKDKAPLGIHSPDATFTTHGTPTSQPDIVVDNTVNHFEHRVRALNRGRNDTSKPSDAYGVRYAWQVGGERPISGADLPKTKFSRKTTHVVTYTEAEKGKTAYYAACYENGKGDAGPWSPIMDAVIG
ncbi:MAG: hypothetical protein LBL06_04800 [Treponema sp.]|jgi:hypothetical protein|nr:hypothetical protein [Treponema sp.]